MGRPTFEMTNGDHAVHLHVKITASQYAILDEMANVKQLPKAKLVREALETFIQKEAASSKA